MDFTADLPALYSALGESVTVAGSPVTAIFDGGYAEQLGIGGTLPTLRCVASDVVGVERGDSVVRAGISYVVTNVEPIPPDEAEKRLILERA